MIQFRSKDREIKFLVGRTSLEEPKRNLNRIVVVITVQKFHEVDGLHFDCNF